MPPTSDALQTLTSYLSATNAVAAIEFYKSVFNAKETAPRIADGNGVVGHATLQIGNTTFYIAEEATDALLNQHVKSPQSLQGSSVILNLMVDDVDVFIEAAEKAGAEIVLRPKDQFYGHRSSRLVDPFGHVWIIASVLEELTDEELMTRVEALYPEK
jgi:PhnB protein